LTLGRISTALKDQDGEVEELSAIRKLRIQRDLDSWETLLAIALISRATASL